MLETVLNIGRILRESGQIKHHRYIKPAPISDKKTPIEYFSIPVKEDLSFDFDEKTKITDEDFKNYQLYYLTFKTSDADSLVKYIFGDIYYALDKKGKEIGYYRLRNDASRGMFSIDSFHRGKEDAKAFTGTIIEKFRIAYEENLEKIDSFLRENSSNTAIFLHFDFSGKSWYQLPLELEAINKKLLSEFLTEQENKYVLQKFLYKTIASADKDVQFPQFTSKNIYKVKSFDNSSEIMDLMYAIDYSQKAIISERSIKIIVLPKGKDLSHTDIESFFERRQLKDQEGAEEKISGEKVVLDDLLDSLFNPLVTNTVGNIKQFDLIFSKAADTGPDVDLVELSGIEKSFLVDLSKKVKRISNLVQEEKNKFFSGNNKKIEYLDIRRSFLNILGDSTKDKKKYQSHLFKVLPQIYRGTYCRDDILLPTFIEKVEYMIREEQPNFNLLKYDYYFLFCLQNLSGDINMEEMKNSESYKMGLFLGTMARPLRKKINSFEKNYVGLLSRRIIELEELMKFANFINEKLTIHEVAYPDCKEAFVKLAQSIQQINSKQYNKNYCAFGFFESYFALVDKKKSSDNGQEE